MLRISNKIFILFCLSAPFLFTCSQSQQAMAQSVTETLTAIKRELIIYKNLAQKHKDTITTAEKNIFRLEKKETAIAEKLKFLHSKFSRLTIVMQKISTRPAFASFLEENSPLSLARTVNLITFFKEEIEETKNTLNSNLRALRNLKQKLNTEHQRYQNAEIALADHNRKIAKLVNTEALISRETKYQKKQAFTKKIINTDLPKDLEELLKALQHNRLEKEHAINALLAITQNSFPNDKPTEKLPENKFADTNKSKLSNTKNIQQKKMPSSFRLSKSFLKNKLDIKLPVAGEIVELFGKTDLIGLTTKGITIITRPGANVVTSFDGKVLYAGSFREYGEILIINHGEGFNILMVGLGRIDVKTGQRLVRGEPVGVMTKPSSTQAKINQKLYIELRKHGKPIDPLAWLSPKRNTT